jgi:hypothetical protein
MSGIAGYSGLGRRPVLRSSLFVLIEARKPG